MEPFCISICVTDQGITVASEPLEEMEQPGEPAESIDAALERARALYQEQAGATADQQAERDFTQGFA